MRTLPKPVYDDAMMCVVESGRALSAMRARLNTANLDCETRILCMQIEQNLDLIRRLLIERRPEQVHVSCPPTSH